MSEVEPKPGVAVHVRNSIYALNLSRHYCVHHQRLGIFLFSGLDANICKSHFGQLSCHGLVLYTQYLFLCF